MSAVRVGTPFRDLLQQQRIVAIVRESSADDAVAAGLRLLTAGVKLIEVSLVTPGACDAIAVLSLRAHEFPESLVGGGTVVSVADVEQVREAGGAFVLSPVYENSMLEAALDAGMSVVPGCATPTEMLDATRRGAEVVKIFPASNWTPRSVRDLLQALPELAVLPTGGVEESSVMDWLASGAVGVGLGSVLKSKSIAEIQSFLGSLPQMTSTEAER